MQRICGKRRFYRFSGLCRLSGRCPPMCPPMFAFQPKERNSEDMKRHLFAFAAAGLLVYLAGCCVDGHCPSGCGSGRPRQRRRRPAQGGACLGRRLLRCLSRRGPSATSRRRDGTGSGRGPAARSPIPTTPTADRVITSTAIPPASVPERPAAGQETQTRLPREDMRRAIARICGRGPLGPAAVIMWHYVPWRQTRPGMSFGF